MTAQPTERDRERAAEVVGIVVFPYDSDRVALEHFVAQALADERERARAPFLALAEELGTLPGLYEREYVADRIRAAAQEPS